MFQTRTVKSIIFEKLRENSVLSFKFLTLELAMSVASTIVERSQLIHNLNLENMNTIDGKKVFS